MYKAATVYITFYLGWFWGSKCNENCKRKFCSVRINLFTNVALPYMPHIIGVLNCSLQNKPHCRPIVGHGVKADQPSSARWKDILHVHFTDRVILCCLSCVASKKIILTVNFKCFLSPSLSLRILLAAFSWSVGSRCSLSSSSVSFAGWFVVFCRWLCTCLWSL